MKVLVLGSSVTLSIRPPRKDRSEGNYSDMLRAALKSQDSSNEVVNLGQGSMVITDIKDWEYIDILKRHNPDVVVLNFGINEAAPRATSLDFWKWLTRSKKRGWFRNKIVEYVYKWSPFLIEKLNLRGWVSAATFEAHLKGFIAQADKECKSRVVVLNIGPPNDNFMAKLPGIEHFVPEYNKSIERAMENENHAVLLDIYKLVNSEGLEKFQPDGCHFSAYGHKVVAQKIMDLIG